MEKNFSVWLIIPQTNLHVGNESVVSFSVVDKAIQRDVTSGLPCINSSSLKGALKEFLTEYENLPNEEKADVKSLFGSVKSDKEDTRKGSAVFFDAQLLFIPQQCTGENVAYKLAYCDEVINGFVQQVQSLGGNCDSSKIVNKVRDKYPVDRKDVYDKFKHLCENESLPIIARNCLENGESVNLWYEQVLPSKSVLATIIGLPEGNELDCLNGKIVQIGANATIGYGYCKFMKL